MVQIIDFSGLTGSCTFTYYYDSNGVLIKINGIAITEPTFKILLPPADVYRMVWRMHHGYKYINGVRTPVLIRQEVSHTKTWETERYITNGYSKHPDSTDPTTPNNVYPVIWTYVADVNPEW